MIDSKSPSQKPSGEAMEKAREIVAHGGPYMTPLSAQALSNSIAHALDTQRASVIEKCAKVALKTELAASPDSRIHELNNARHQIAEAIRSLKNG